MAYKARRTRDLQGEVQAGTNVSVSETTKPDGTKVFTLSADSGEIPTLADMSNSFSLAEYGVSTYKSGDKTYLYGGDLIFMQGTNFYEKEEVYVSDLSDTLIGIKIKTSGYYKLLFTYSGEVETLGTINDYTLHLSICDISNGELSSEEDVITEAYVNGNGTWFNFTYETFVYLEMDKVISFEIDIEDANVADISSYDKDPHLSIQKVR